MMRDLLRSVLGLGDSGAKARVKVLFVCMGNICRSPTAEAVFRHKVQQAGLGALVHCASAGTHDFHVGSLPDGRARAAAQKRGYDMSRLRGRHVAEDDFERYDLILTMDRQNMQALEQRCPSSHREKLRMLMEFSRRHDALDVPDPYYGSVKAFEIVLDMLEDACESLLEHIREHRLGDREAPAAR
jgi:protein-tyrosine phosphatase